jgi:hypothetical protein
MFGMGKKPEKGKPGKKGKKNRPDPGRVAAYARLYEVETRLYQLWEKRTDGEMTWVGEALGAPVDEDMTLWLSAIGDKVAALGGELRLVAVFPNETVTLLVEPGINS